MVIRSYRRVFRVDRRIYRVDRWALPVPGGVPLRGIGYFVLALLAVLLLEHVPPFSLIFSMINAPLKYVVAPIAAAVFASQATPDGRPAHRFALAWVRIKFRADRQSTHWHARVKTKWDVHAPDLHKSRVRGPAVVTFNVPVKLGRKRGKLTARGGGDHASRDAVVNEGVTLEVRK